MKRCLWILPVVFAIGCGDEKNEEKEIKQVFKSESILIDDTSFPFQHDSIPLILEQVKLCKIMDSITQDTTVPPCHHELFRYFSNHREPVDEGFLVEVKPRVWSKFFLVINIAKNKSGEYYKSNAFHGQLMELRTTPSG